MTALRRQAFEQVIDPRMPSIARLATMVGIFQSTVIEALAAVGALPFVGGVQVEVPALAAAGTFNVPHGLRRVARGYLVTSTVRAAAATASLSVYRRKGDANTDSALTLYCNNSFESLTLWVW